MQFGRTWPFYSCCCWQTCERLFATTRALWIGTVQYCLERLWASLSGTRRLYPMNCVHFLTCSLAPDFFCAYHHHLTGQLCSVEKTNHYLHWNTRACYYALNEFRDLLIRFKSLELMVKVLTELYLSRFFLDALCWELQDPPRPRVKLLAH